MNRNVGDRYSRPSLKGQELADRLSTIASMLNRGERTPPEIFNELDARQHVFEAHQAACDLVEQVEWAHKLAKDGGGDLSGPRMIRELVETLVGLLTEDIDTGLDDRSLLMSCRRSVLVGDVDGLMSEGAFELSEINELLEYLYPVLSCGHVR